MGGFGSGRPRIKTPVEDCLVLHAAMAMIYGGSDAMPEVYQDVGGHLLFRIRAVRIQ